ncbi:MAG: type IV toxin-antitoxin system AbiEi family antitoxin domain-containing protein [Candidatus Marinimicrobia bacterium]|nr:type IV toxin-antitoxin system AbiEi family antitoxin domain-containing protein [Candidatus Neomarinimicrobiota bacterium]
MPNAYQRHSVNYIYLVIEAKKSPTWYKKYYSDNLLFTEVLLNGHTEHQHKNFAINISSAERAILDMLYHFLRYHSFGESYQIMENVITLHPKIYQYLLEFDQG